MGCELGALSTELSDHDGAARIDLDAHLTSWISQLTGALERMKTIGVLTGDADPRMLATGIMAALHGGYVLAQAARDPEPVEVALTWRWTRSARTLRRHRIAGGARPQR